MDGKLSGTLERLESELLTVRYKDSTRLNTWILLEHLDDEVREPKMDIRIQTATVLPWHIQEILPELDLPYNWRAMGKVEASGNFSGQPDDFVIDLDLTSRLGNISTIMRILPGAVDKQSPLRYSGYLRTQELAWDDLGISPQISSSSSIFRQ